jgi:hypothetical protein
MNARRPDPATVAVDAVALASLRRRSRQDAAARCEETKTTLYLRSEPAPPRPVRRRAALFETMTVRAVAALSSVTPGGHRAHPPARRTRSPNRRTYARWALAFAGAALAGSAAALLTATLIASQQAPARPAHPAKLSLPMTATTRRDRTPTPAPTLTAPAAAVPPATAPSGTAPAASAPTVAPYALRAPTTPRLSRARPATTANAVDALAAGDYPTALARYRELAAREPEQPVFAAIVRMLERDLAHDCDPAAAPAGTACAY